MTAPLRGTPHASALPASQTAPVAEFRCLFTHDVRRKQKRWQDGYLKFHTFNNRVMVSDQARNHIGDTYWKESNELQEGDEVTLDKGVMVEVAEAMGITQTDLAPLFEKRPKEPTKEPPARPAPSSTTRPFQRPTSVAPSSVPRPGTQLRHKSLNTLLGTPKGPVGKAVPMQSPYEARREKENELAEERAPKRQKTTARYTGWRASSPMQGDESPPSRATPSWVRMADAKNARSPHAPPPKPVTISSESDHVPIFTSDITLPSPPPKVVKARPIQPVKAAPSVQAAVLPPPPPVQTPKAPRTKVRLPKAKAVQTPKQPDPTSSPPVSASNRLTNVDFAVQTVQKPPKKASPPPSPPRNPKAKSLRLSAGVRRGTLLCQALPKQPSRVDGQARVTTTRLKPRKTSRTVSREPSPALARRVESASGAVSNLGRVATKSKASNTEPELVPSDFDEDDIAFDAPQDIFEDPEIYHGLMDQQLLHPPSPPEAGRQPPHEVIASNPSSKSRKPRPSKPPEREVIDVEDDQPPMPKSTKAKATRERNRTTDKTRPERAISPPGEAVLKPPVSARRQISPTLSVASEARSRTTSTSPSKKLLSIGGFPMKTKRLPKKASPPAQPSGDNVALVPRRETVALPPHPLLANKNGPLMSTTELASLLKKPKKRSKPDDPIEDDATATGKSPARKMRRVRSANDAPIPSTAEDWEKRNLPKTSSNLTEVESAAPMAPPKKKESTLAALTKKTDPRKKFKRTQSLNVDTSSASLGQVDEVDLPSPVIDIDVGPWSTEAFDLFDWRPPGRERGEGIAA
ncbi:hypothetical protein FB567DRAFT_535834 [Paraphoma chrysanthemicola]|uniref:5'-3' DNA helicase ZGRF1-like N-terminal domain-containing protein n=1 Tax=Paraphoma chrysanthemicola TaxID=798071 RepID=A0A8K0QWE2_9PLEO|nr:hypothetical protein FB567DRAFT_535834 [Paraphoma chrysanthemicola]